MLSPFHSLLTALFILSHSLTHGDWHVKSTRSIKSMALDVYSDSIVLLSLEHARFPNKNTSVRVYYKTCPSISYDAKVLDGHQKLRILDSKDFIKQLMCNEITKITCGPFETTLPEKAFKEKSNLKGLKPIIFDL